MYFSPTDSVALRQDSLDLHTGWLNFNLDTVGKFSAIALRNTRLLGELSSQLSTCLTAEQALNGSWLERLDDAKQQLTRNVDDFYETTADLHKGLLRLVEGQTALYDRFLCQVLSRAGSMSPWEGEVVLMSMKNAVESGDATMHGLTESAADVVDIIEEQLVHSLESVAPQKPAPTRAVSRKRVTPSQN